MGRSLRRTNGSAWNGAPGPMPTDLQIIDGFEALRTAMLEANPGAVLDPNPESSASMARAARPLAEVLEAWLGASLSLNGSTGQERRLLRALIRSCSAEDAGAPEESEAVLEAARPLLERHPRLLARTSEGARALRGLMNGDGKVAPPKAAATLAAEAAAWANLLPGLGGLKAWRMLERLGRAVIVPEARVRRFFWRLGLIEGNPSGAAASAARVATPAF